MPRYLIDTSALARLTRQKELRANWQQALIRGTIGLCPITELELLHSARSPIERTSVLNRLHNEYCWVPMPDRVFQRAVEIQELLTKQGQHRCASPVDLLVAATGELNGLTILHYDRDYETIAKVTGQPVEWLAPPGSLN
ncbi:PIN domain nuclease [Sphaerisporangium sp. NPDC005288]|uniref:PIN domain nuclease n=1 Tax=Sphaerisporangium sp. NPDC005288 TaxID=3155114 RepID=UPI0033AB5ABF